MSSTEATNGISRRAVLAGAAAIGGAWYGINITNVEGEGCGTCSIAEALKRSLNTAYYRLMLKLKNGAQDVADAAHRAGIATSFPGFVELMRGMGAEIS